MPDAVETTNLFFRAGGSDKVYSASIEPSGPGYIVTFAYGRRGGSLATGQKTPTPVSIERARAVYEKLIFSKTAKGYQRGGEIATYAPSPEDFESVASPCQLLNPVERDEAERLIRDDSFVAQEKLDGKRLQIGRAGSSIFALNRRGKPCAFPLAIQAALTDLPDGAPPLDFVMDGELVDDVYHAFDALSIGALDLRPRPFLERYGALAGIVEGIGSPFIRSVRVMRTTEEKRKLFEDVEAAGREGVVFKSGASPYTAGRPASGGEQLKFKFTETCTARVVSVNDRRSVALELVAGEGEWVGVGNVTVPANQQIPAPGSLVEVRYLYAFEGGSLFQPVLLGSRDDLDPDDCTLEQLKYKPESANMSSRQAPPPPPHRM